MAKEKEMFNTTLTNKMYQYNITRNFYLYICIEY